MKSFKGYLSLLALSFISASAFADSGMVCHTPGVMDAGHTIVVSKDGKTASVSAITIAGARPLAELTCTGRLPLSYTRDIALPMLRCGEPQLRDAGYSIIVTESHTTGEPIATLSQISFFGAKVIDRLECSPANF
jgi:hypothetical protein